jgi:hypothetical protein
MGLHWTFSEQVGAERVDSAKACLLEMREGMLDVVAGFVACRGAASVLELLAEAQLELTCSLLGESYTGDAIDRRFSSRDH